MKSASCSICKHNSVCDETRTQKCKDGGWNEFTVDTEAKENVDKSEPENPNLTATIDEFGMCHIDGDIKTLTAREMDELTKLSEDSFKRFSILNLEINKEEWKEVMQSITSAAFMKRRVAVLRSPTPIGEDKIFIALASLGYKVERTHDDEFICVMW